MHTRRSGRLTGATAQRLLDGGDGPAPLPQLLAAATAPATAAELHGETAARAAFRSSTHSVPLPRDIPRRTPVHATSSIIIGKVIAAITLTASTAGGITLATTSTPADQPARTTSESTATDDTAPSLVIASPTPTGSLDDPEDLAGSDEAAGTPAAGASDPADDADGAVHATRSPKPAHPTGRCRALTNISQADQDDQAGKATDSPAFTDLNCAPTDTAAGLPRPTGRPDVAPGNPDQHTGKPDTTGREQDADDTDEEVEKSEKAGKNEDTSDAQPDADGGATADRGKSGEHRQDG